MRIVVDQPGMRSAAAALDDSGLGFADSAVRLGGLPLPEMPAWLVSELSQLLRDASPRLRSGSEESRLLAAELRLRALAADVGGWLRTAQGSRLLHEVEKDDELVKPFTAAADLVNGSGDLAGDLATYQVLRLADTAGRAALDYGPESAEALRSWFGLEQAVSAFADPGVASELLAGGARSADVEATIGDAARAGLLGGKLDAVAGGAGRVIEPLAGFANFVVLVGPSQYANPVRDGANRFFAGVALVGLAMGPEGAPLLLVAAGWQITNWTIDNWPTISRDAVRFGRAAWHGYEDLGRAEDEALGDIGSGFAHGAKSVEGATVSTARNIAHDVDPRSWL